MQIKNNFFFGKIALEKSIFYNFKFSNFGCPYENIACRYSRRWKFVWMHLMLSLRGSSELYASRVCYRHSFVYFRV